MTDFLILDNEITAKREAVYFKPNGEITEYWLWSISFQEWFEIPIENLKKYQTRWDEVQNKVYIYLDRKSRRVV